MNGRSRLIAAALATVVLALAVADVCMAELPDSGEEITRHLEFLGYSVQKDDESLMVRHETKYNFGVRKFRGGTMFNAFWGSSEYAKEHRNEFLEFANDLNRMSSATVFYVDKDQDLAASFWFAGPYEKQVFATLIERFSGDLDLIVRIDFERTKKLLQ